MLQAFELPEAAAGAWGVKIFFNGLS